MTSLRASVLALAAFSAGCAIELAETIEGSGTSVSELRVVSGFDRVRVEDHLECAIVVESGPSMGRSTVAVHGDDNLLPYVETDLDGETLVVRVASGVRLDPAPRVAVRLPHLGAVALEGSGAVTVDRAHGPSLRVELAGSGSIAVTGEVDELEVDLEGSGEVDLSGLVARLADVESTGSGYVVVHVTEALAADTEGSGDIAYRGPAKVSARVSGSGTVRRVDG